LCEKSEGIPGIAGMKTMLSERSSQVTEQMPRDIKPAFFVSGRTAPFLVAWLFAWPLVIFLYDPLTKPYEPLTLLLVVPGGAVWLFSFLISCVFVYETLFYLAAECWPRAKKIKTAIELLITTLWNVMW
jgi:hypothetical protein